MSKAASPRKIEYCKAGYLLPKSWSTGSSVLESPTFQKRHQGILPRPAVVPLKRHVEPGRNKRIPINLFVQQTEQIQLILIHVGDHALVGVEQQHLLIFISHDFSSSFVWVVAACYFNYTTLLEENQMFYEPEVL